MPGRDRIHPRSVLAGAAAALSLAQLAAGIFAWVCPTETVAGPLARMLDPAAPALVAGSLVFAVVVAVAGARLSGAALAFAALSFAAIQVASYRGVSLPPAGDAAVDMRVLFFNVSGRNSVAGDRIVAAAIETGADIVVFAEAGPVLPSMERLLAAYEFVSPCNLDECELLVATNIDVIRFWRLQLNPAWPARYAVLEIAGPDGEPVFVAASHLLKPWMSGLAESEIARLAAQYDWLPGPVLAVGDFNMPPWSLPMRRLLERTGFRATRGQPATWPAWAGPGLPIDQVLVHDGARVVRVSGFGGGLGSNHLGIVADVSLQRAPD